MGKIATIMEAGIAGLINALEFRKHQSSPQNASISPEHLQFENKKSFRAFITGEKQNKNYLYVILLLGCLQFIFFKLLYPFPDFISDSYSYIDTNLYQMDVNLWPVGYSKYLRLIHFITPSATFLVFTQFIILQISLTYFFYSILYLFDLSKMYANILFAFLFFNPLFFYLANCVLSDAIFCTISLVLFTQYLWMFYRPKPLYIFSTALLIGFAFTLRYTAIFYPLIGTMTFMLSRQPVKSKILGIISPLFLIIPFVLYTQQKTKQKTGTSEFSVFGGWQLVNNALYMYDHITVDQAKLPAEMKELDNDTKDYFKRIPPFMRDLDPFPGTFFIKQPTAILKPYLLKKYTFTDPPSQFEAWGKVSPLYKKYGMYLIKNHPIPFIKYYILLNVGNYFFPHLEKFNSYNLNMDTTWDDAKVWFHWDSNAVTSPPRTFQEHIFFFYPIIFMMANAYFSIIFFSYIIGKRKQIGNKFLSAAVILACITLFLNFCFSVFATPVVLRYQIFPLILLVTFSFILTDHLDRFKKDKHLVLIKP